MGSLRLLDPDGDITPDWRRVLDRSLPEGWFDRLYKKAPQQTFFEADVGHVRKTPLGIAKYVLEEMRAIFADVANAPALLKNSRNSPLYLFCFAASNKYGAPIAVRIANSVLRKGLS